jgi:hypothetical protein
MSERFRLILDGDPALFHDALALALKQRATIASADIGYGWSFWSNASTRFRCFMRRTATGMSVHIEPPQPSPVKADRP